MHPAVRCAGRPQGGSGANLSSAPGLAVPDGILDLAYASLPASGEVVHRAFASALTELPALLPGFGYDALGVDPLREAIARHYSTAGMPTTARQILVTSGAQHALNIVLRTLAGRSDKVLVEHPSYPNALDAIRAAGCRLVPVAMPAAHPDTRSGAHSGGRPGWDLDAIETALKQQRPAMAYVVPDFHNPTGRLMPDSQRRRLVRAAAEAGTVLVVDETLRELNLDGVASTPLAAFSPAVVSIGSLSKSHWAGLRTGWIRAEEPLIQRFAAARTTMDLGGPVVEQLAAAHLVNALAEPPRRAWPPCGTTGTHCWTSSPGGCRAGRANGPTAACPCGAASRPRSAPPSPWWPRTSASGWRQDPVSAPAARSSTISGCRLRSRRSSSRPRWRRCGLPRTSWRAPAAAARPRTPPAAAIA